MKLAIKYVKDPGDLRNERVILKAIDNENIGSYLISDTTYEGDNEVSNKLRHVFWIPDQEVSKDDLIVIYTKEGKDKSKKNESGRSTHFFYWGLKRTVWNVDQDAVTLFSIAEWDLKKVER